MYACIKETNNQPRRSEDFFPPIEFFFRPGDFSVVSEDGLDPEPEKLQKEILRRTTSLMSPIAM